MGLFNRLFGQKPQHTMSLPPTKMELVGCSGFVSGLDERYVVKNFLGKTQADARKMYPTGQGFSTEDFTYMTSDGLRYYLPPAFDYLRDDESAHDWEFCHGLFCSLSCQFGPHRSPASDVALLIKEIARYCDSHREKFGLDPQEDLFDGYLQKIFAA
jgi:hypothetical protein